jgi:hypothetical protein
MLSARESRVRRRARWRAQARSHKLWLWLRPEERAELRREARRLGLTVSALVRLAWRLSRAARESLTPRNVDDRARRATLTTCNNGAAARTVGP